MKIIGLCGGSGSGKGIVCEIFREFNIPTIDTDAVYHELTNSRSACLDTLESEFGSEIITDGKSLNRKRLAEIVFMGENRESRLARLNEIAHKYILNETRARLEVFKQNGAAAAVVDAPLLFESGFYSECDVLVCVIAGKETRIKRIMGRDGISEEQAKWRIASQLSNDELISRSDFVIYNESDISSLRHEVSSVLSKILEK